MKAYNLVLGRVFQASVWRLELADWINNLAVSGLVLQRYFLASLTVLLVTEQPKRKVRGL